MRETLSQSTHEAPDFSEQSSEVVVERIGHNDLSALHEQMARNRQAEQEARNPSIEAARSEVENAFSTPDQPADELTSTEPVVTDYSELSDQGVAEHIGRNDLNALSELFKRQKTAQESTSVEGNSDDEPQAENAKPVVGVSMTKHPSTMQPLDNQEKSISSLELDEAFMAGLNARIDKCVTDVEQAERGTRSNSEAVTQNIATLTRLLQGSGLHKIPGGIPMRRFTSMIEGITDDVMRLHKNNLNAEEKAKSSVAAIGGRATNEAEVSDGLRQTLQSSASLLSHEIQSASDNGSTRNIISQLDALRQDASREDIDTIVARLRSISVKIQATSPSYSTKIRAMQHSLSVMS